METVKQVIYCERCGEKLNPERAKWLELSQTDGKFYSEIPEGHQSQGAFSFGSACAVAQIKQTIYQNETEHPIFPDKKLEIELLETELRRLEELPFELRLQEAIENTKRKIIKLKQS